MRLKRLCYSEILLEEKQYGYVQDKMLRTKRRGQVLIGHARKNIANSLTESAKKDIDKKKAAGNSYRNLREQALLGDNKEITRKLLRQIHNDGGRTMNGSSIGLNDCYLKPGVGNLLSNVDTGDFSKSENTEFNKVRNHLNRPNNSGIIFINDKTSVAGLAHEKGHLDNRKSESIYKSTISDLSNVAGNLVRSTRVGKSVSTNNPIKSVIAGGIVNAEERNASRNAIRNLKELGLQGDQLSLAKKTLDSAYNTYKYDNRAKTKSVLANFVQIPSRKLPVKY